MTDEMKCGPMNEADWKDQRIASLEAYIAQLKAALPAQGEPVAIYQTMCTDDDERHGTDLWMDVAREAFEAMRSRSDMRSRIVYAALPSSPAPLVAFDAKHAVLKAHPSDREAGVQLFLEYLDVSEEDFVYEEAMTPEEYIYGIRSPAPASRSLNSGESDLQVTADYGAGEAIFSECAEIALGHVDNGNWDDPEIYSDGYDQACRDIAEAIRTRAANRKTMDAIADAAGERK